MNTRTPHKRSGTLARALAGPRFLLSAWMWCFLAYVATTFVVGAALTIMAAPLHTPWAMSAVVLLEGTFGPEPIGPAVFFGFFMVLAAGPLRDGLTRVGLGGRRIV